MSARDVLLAVVLIVVLSFVATVLLGAFGPMGTAELLLVVVVVTVGVLLYMMKRRSATRS